MHPSTRPTVLNALIALIDETVFLALLISLATTLTIVRPARRRIAIAS